MHDALLNYVVSLLNSGHYPQVRLLPGETLKVRRADGRWSDTDELVTTDELDALVAHLRVRSHRQWNDVEFQFLENGSVFEVVVADDSVLIAPAKDEPAIDTDEDDARYAPTEAEPEPASVHRVAVPMAPTMRVPPPIPSASARPAPAVNPMPDRNAGAAPRVAAPEPARSSHRAGTPPNVPVPGILRWRQATLGRLAGLGGVMIGTLVVACLHLLLPTTSVLGRICDLNRMEGMVTLAVAVLFMWSLLLCVVRFLILQRMQLVSKDQVLVHTARLLSKEGVAAQAEALLAPQFQHSPLIRRLAGVTRQWQLKPGLQEASLVLQEQSAGDEEEAQGLYSLVRAFVWALPVLGLIGTVIGIGSAVGNFATFLGGKVDDVAAIKQSLIGVTSNLSFAFYITLEGLLSSLVVMLTASALESRDTQFIQRLGQSITEIFMPVLQTVAPERSGVALSDRDAGALRDTLQRVGIEVLDTIGVEARSDRQQAAQELTDWTTAVRQELDAAAASMAHVIRESGNMHSHALTNVGSSVERLIEALGNHHRQLVGQAESSHRISEGATQVAASLAQCMTPVGQLEKSLAAFASNDTQRTLARLGETIAEASRVSGQTMAALFQLKDHTKDLLGAQAALQTAVTQFQSTGLTEGLHELRGTLGQMAQALDGFRQPFVLQAVPSGPRQA